MKKIAFFSVAVFIIALSVIVLSCGSTAKAPTPKQGEPAPVWGPHLSPEMILVPGGSFTMGSTDVTDLDAMPVHQVTMDGFYLGKYEVTQALYWAVTGRNPSCFQGDSIPEGYTSCYNFPVERVSWFDAVEFCNELSVLEGLTPVYSISNKTPKEGHPISEADVNINWKANGYRLPTEAEWEYAAKGGNGPGPYYIYAGSNDPHVVAWFNDNSPPEIDFNELNSDGKTTIMVKYAGDSHATFVWMHPVGLKAPNSLGFHDMSGNVWEWCWDLFGEYTNASLTNPKGPESGPGRTYRGGAYSYAGSSVLRIANRNFWLPYVANDVIGFRLARNL